MTPREFEELCVRLLDRFGSPLPHRKTKLPRIASVRTSEATVIYVKETEECIYVSAPGYKSFTDDDTRHIYYRLKRSDQITNWHSLGAEMVADLIKQRLILDLLADI